VSLKYLEKMMTRWIVETEEPRIVEIVFRTLEEAEDFVSKCISSSASPRIFKIKKYKQVKDGNFSNE
jgi:hypothetical protein